MSLNMRNRQKQLQNLLRSIRKEAGMSQQELADRLRRPQSFVSKYESGERRLDIIELLEICDVVDMDLGDFIRRLRTTMGET